ncbi:hypothetical protein [Bacillus weihaiensis]|uniref:Uncharacterized protein n=1 Tax=Bacillus weihaiensis TaxID=1547283 RepID=A0A1L3MXZ8_9BACI|nr:hypothetical protein [Bacillus weihaiensis]APH07212.1 hypothetical protein A9C19_20725 [Bacillus weihaiensis]
MYKTIRIDGKNVSFKGDKYITQLYRQELGRNFIKDFKSLRNVVKYNIVPMRSPIKDLKKVNFEALYLICWIFAKNADKSIGNSEEWLEEFEQFPILHVITELSEIIQFSLTGKTFKVVL